MIWSLRGGVYGQVGSHVPLRVELVHKRDSESVLAVKIQLIAGTVLLVMHKFAIQKSALHGLLGLHGEPARKIVSEIESEDATDKQMTRNVQEVQLKNQNASFHVAEK